MAPGGNCTLSVVFQPTVIGFKGGVLSLSDSASSKPQVIELSGTGTVISLSPPQLNFGSQKVGTKSVPQNVTVTNTGSTAVNVTSVKIAGSDSKDYSETNTCAGQIGPGASCTISVAFAPTKTGTRTADAQINDNGGGSPQTVQLTGHRNLVQRFARFGPLPFQHWRDAYNLCQRLPVPRMRAASPALIATAYVTETRALT